jgi:hypothetical protein
MTNFALGTRRTVLPRRPVKMRGISFEAFPVIHSIRAPAVGYRISAGRASSAFDGMKVVLR